MKSKKTSVKQTVLSEDKSGGILGLLDHLQRDELNSLSLLTAVGVERRKFLIESVMPQAATVKVKMDKLKFEAIKTILHADETTKREALTAESGLYTLLGYGLSGYTFRPASREKTPPRKVREAFSPRPLMPWLERKQFEQRCTGSILTEDDEIGFRSPGCSKVLPSLRKLPPTTTKRMSVFHRGLASSGPRESDMDALIALEKFTRQYNVQVTSGRPVHKANRCINNCATERVRFQKDIERFQDEFLPRRASELRAESMMCKLVDLSASNATRQVRRARAYDTSRPDHILALLIPQQPVEDD